MRREKRFAAEALQRNAGDGNYIARKQGAKTQGVDLVEGYQASDVDEGD